MTDVVPSKLAAYRRMIGGALCVYWLLLFAATHMPPPDLSSLPKDSDKFLHLVAYAGLAYLLGLWRSITRPTTAGLLLRVFAVVAVYAVIDELLQIPVNRHADVKDVAADTIGGVLGLIALRATWTVWARWRAGDRAEHSERR